MPIFRRIAGGGGGNPPPRSLRYQKKHGPERVKRNAIKIYYHYSYLISTQSGLSLDGFGVGMGLLLGWVCCGVCL